MGLFPLIPYIIEASIKKDNKTHHLIACIIIAVILLFIFGLAKAALAQLNILKSAIETLVFGILAVGAGYGVGLLFHT
jgi:VIT1/CCC1 family predicted Fe2+/Mn2+ transporter